MSERENQARRMQDETFQSIRALNDHICLMDYRCDYNLPGMLEAGKTSLFGMVRFMEKQIRDPRLLPNPAHGHGGCSTFKALTPEGKVLMGRNFDYRKKGGCVAMWTHPPEGYRSLSMVDQSLLLYRDVRDSHRPLRLLGAPYATVDGINEKGLACAILELMTTPTRQRTGKTPITTNVALRGMLDTCASVDEAIGFLDCYDMHDVLGACYHYQITDAQGRGAVVEYVGGVMHVHRADRPDEPLQLTNHFITPGSGQRVKFGRNRYEHIECFLKEKPVMEEADAMRLLSESTLLIKLKRTLFSTLWSAVYNCTDRTMLLSVMRDYTHQYRFSLDKPCEATPVTGFDAQLSDQPVEVGLFRKVDLEAL